MAVINGLLNDPRNFQARRLLNQLEEPARTRAQFYLGQRLTKVGRNVATQEDMNLAIGGACRDRLEDSEVRFSREDILKAVECADDGRRVQSLREVVDGLTR